MPLLLIILIAILIAQIGFWDTIGVMLGAVAAVVLFVVILAATAIVAGLLLLRRMRRPRY
jgi:hypothetical protein